MRARSATTAFTEKFPNTRGNVGKKNRSPKRAIFFILFVARSVQGDALIAVNEAVILDQAVKQSCRPLLDSRIQKLTAEGLKRSVDRRLNQAQIANARCLVKLLMEFQNVTQQESNQTLPTPRKPRDFLPKLQPKFFLSRLSIRANSCLSRFGRRPCLKGADLPPRELCPPRCIRTF